MSETTHWTGSDPHTTSMSLQVDEVGVVDVTHNLICEDVTQAKSAIAISAADCPLGLSRPFVKGTSLDRIEGGMYQASLNFSAVLEEDLIGDYKTYTCSTTGNKEPIQTHPDFAKFAGTKDEQINGSVFDDKGNFERFKPFITAGEQITKGGEQVAASANGKNRKCGISDYNVPIVHLEETMLVFQEDLAALVDELTYVESNMPSTPLLPSWPNRTWLLTEANPTWVGFEVFKLKRKWSLSGPRGWDGDVYPKT